MAQKRKKPVKSKSRQGARRKIDPATGKEISRYAFEKKYGRKKRVFKKSSPQKFSHKLKLYRLIRDDYIEAQKKKGIVVTRAEAMRSEELKKIIVDLHSKNPKRKARALAKTGRITPDQIELYVNIFTDDQENEL